MAGFGTRGRRGAFNVSDDLRFVKSFEYESFRTLGFGSADESRRFARSLRNGSGAMAHWRVLPRMLRVRAMRSTSLLSALCAMALAVASINACSAQSRDVTAKGTDAGPGGPGSGGQNGEIENSFADGSAPEPHDVVATLKGNVRAPNPQMPISGALVYLTDTPPEPRPAGVHCDTCVTLTEGVPYALSEPDGSFELPSYKLGERYLVVQKGGFRRVRQITIEAGDQDIERVNTTLPPSTNAAKNDEVPPMAVLEATFDKISESLEELGLQGSAYTTISDVGSFLRDSTRMSEFEIIFIPCGTDYDLSTDPTIIQNLKEFVQAGGRVYATDWHYDFVHQTWPGYVSWEGQSQEPCSGCSGSMYNAPAKVEDQGLKDWLQAQNINSFQLEKNYTTITNVNARPGKDKDGKDVTITPKVWVNGVKPGGAKPTTVSFEQGCGRVLFSTYHTESSATVMPQERALLYVLLEVSVCTEAPEGVIVR